MREVFNYIEERSAQYDQRAMFRYLRDSNVDFAERLAFVPWLSHFVMTFADLYNSFFVQEPPRDQYQALANTHLREESTHWKWFLTDLETLGLNPTLPFTDALRVLWSEDTLMTRRLAYEMCQLSQGMTSLEKLAMICAIEATGRVALEALVPVGNAVAAARSAKLVYFGQHHLDTERTHTVEVPEVQRSLQDVALTDEQLVSMRRIVDKVFYHFTEFADEAYGRAASRSEFPGPVAKFKVA